MDQSTAKADRLQVAIQHAENWQYRGNVALERGERDRAERAFEKSQYWRDRMNRLLGNGDGSER